MIRIQKHIKQTISRGSECGFSLMEMVIATGIFLIISLATLGLFSASLQGQRTALVQTRVGREAQLILETVTRKIRGSRVDYAVYGGTVTNPVTQLSLIDQADSRIDFIYDNVNQELDISIDGSAPRSISSSEAQITSLEFFIEPTTDPFGTGNQPAVQPRVTMVMTLQATESKNQISVTVQQTVPQRGGGF